MFTWDAWVFVFWQELGERWRRIDEDMWRLIDEGWREVIWVKNARTKKASGGSQEREKKEISRKGSSFWRTEK